MTTALRALRDHRKAAEGSPSQEKLHLEGRLGEEILHRIADPCGLKDVSPVITAEAVPWHASPCSVSAQLLRAQQARQAYKDAWLRSYHLAQGGFVSEDSKCTKCVTAISIFHVAFANGACKEQKSTWNSLKPSGFWNTGKRK